VTAGAIEKPGFSADFFDLTAKYVRISPVSGRFARPSRLLSLLVDRPFCKEKSTLPVLACGMLACGLWAREPA